ncbi:MAG: ThiF family adenylyltransferase [Candidatus Pseudobacter hemicellulosilyticus]|uniref:ThiF family adenylyltransferase n=1 Tax=Candidatus Pseudobacter hemicellulosilyticus TaxID=3121375 RepID=A0AAJ6BH40_9BACT|nr:MAG: ThiF family adenylyltransferase [Pseudobacter sp.]
MSHKLISLNPDLKRLQDEGYEVEVRGGYLIIHHIPYANSEKQVKYGTLVCPLTLNVDKTLQPNDHIMHFIGQHPHNADGTIITAIQHASVDQTFAEGLTVNHSFSNKPANGYPDFYEKASTYASIISAQAKAIDKAVTEKTFRVIAEIEEDTVFQYADTNVTRSNIGIINKKQEGHKIAIIGLGGTGGYILDLVAKTPVAEIHLYDGDRFFQHNAFRSPGAATIQELNEAPYKVDYYKNKYIAIHKNIVAHPYKVGESNINEIKDKSHVFISIDHNSSRKQLMAALLKMQIPFIDTGIGVEVVDQFLIGSVRTTTATPQQSDHLADRVPVIDHEDEAYKSNIQIADLNMLNAFMAVHKWKKMVGFYQDLIGEHHSIYSINASHLDSTVSTA